MIENRMRDIVVASGQSQAYLSRMFGISQPRFNQYLTGKREPDLAFIKKFCDFFHITPNTLLGYDNKPIVNDNYINISETDFRDTVYTAYTVLCEYIMTNKKNPSMEEMGQTLAKLCYNGAKLDPQERKGTIKGIVIGLYDDTHMAS